LPERLPPPRQTGKATVPVDTSTTKIKAFWLPITVSGGDPSNVAGR
jgi:hypothetical protein